MKRFLLVVCILFVAQSCIPLRIAPNIEDYKVATGKKFKRSLSKRNMFIFEDPKDPNHFYDYVNIKYQLEDENVYDDVPFKINGQQYFFSFYEVDIPDKTINFFNFFLSNALSAALNSEDDNDAVPEEIRKDNYYLAIEVYNDIEKDCLDDNSLSREVVLKYLRTLKEEYLSTHNYNEVVFKN